jgi:hypothetical protein
MLHNPLQATHAQAQHTHVSHGQSSHGQSSHGQSDPGQSSHGQANPAQAETKLPRDDVEHNHFTLAERRNAMRMPVIKSAKVITGGEVNQSVYNCLVLDESSSGVLVDLGAIFSLPEEVVLHMTCGASYKARRCWAVGTKVGLAFTSSQMLNAEILEKLAQLGRMMQAQGLPAIMAALRAHHFFDNDEVRRAAEAAEASYHRFEAVLMG